MRNYIRADMKCILSRTSHTLSMLLLFAIYACAVILPNRGSQVTSVSLINSACGTLGMILLFFGLFEMIAVFSEDFKVKTMQVAIGLGVTRNKVVICKLLEVVILLVLDAIVLLGITVGAGALLGISIPFGVLKDLINTLLVQGILGNTVFTGLTMIVLFATHSSVLAIFVYMLVGLDIVSILLTVLPLVGFEWIEALHLNNLTLSHCLNAFDARLALGSFDILPFLGMAAYLAAGLLATCKLFSKRELDF